MVSVSLIQIAWIKGPLRSRIKLCFKGGLRCSRKKPSEKLVFPNCSILHGLHPCLSTASFTACSPFLPSTASYGLRLKERQNCFHTERKTQDVPRSYKTSDLKQSTGNSLRNHWRWQEQNFPSIDIFNGQQGAGCISRFNS